MDLVAEGSATDDFIELSPDLIEIFGPFRKLSGSIKGKNDLAQSRGGAEEFFVFPCACAPLRENTTVPRTHIENPEAPFVNRLRSLNGTPKGSTRSIDTGWTVTLGRQG